MIKRYYNFPNLKTSCKQSTKYAICITYRSLKHFKRIVFLSRFSFFSIKKSIHGNI